LPGERNRFPFLWFQYWQICTFIHLVSNLETLAKYPQINENLYALILMAITTFYVVKGGMFSVVITEVIQYGILTIAAIAIGIIAIHHVSPDALNAVLPEGWKSIGFGWKLGLDWNNLSGAASPKLSAFSEWIAKDGYEMFGLFYVMMHKGLLHGSRTCPITTCNVFINPHP
jgi:hypothetical protein